jgi:hypothetical protein
VKARDVKFEQRTVPCVGCGRPTTYTGTQHCDPCHGVQTALGLSGETAVLRMTGLCTSPPYGRLGLQHEMLNWALDMFGPAQADPRQRALRLLEEALEAAQAAGVAINDVLRLAHHVNDRTVGEPRQELGGCFVTLLSLAEAQGYNLWLAGVDEVERVRALDRDAVRAKHAHKVQRGVAL